MWGGMEEGSVREKRKADKKEGKKAGWLDGRELLRRKKGAYCGSPPLEGSAAPGRNAIFGSQRSAFSLKRNHRLQKRKG